jgi:outer membrane protein assembly factor BamB
MKLKLSFFALLLSLALTRGEDWPCFRGPSHNGKSPATKLPLTWSETNHIKWKTDVHGKAWSCPVVAGNQVWVTTATKDGKQLSIVQLNRDTGKIERDEILFEVETPQFCHDFNSYASPTPVVEGDRIYVTFGSPGTACLDTKTGQKIWERRDFVCNHFRGAGSSPVIYGNLLLLHFDGSDYQFVVAMDKNTGKTVWKTDRSVDFQDLKNGKPDNEGDYRKAFSTPYIAQIDGRDQMLSLGSRALYSYDPSNGKEIWRVEERKCQSGSSMPVYVDGLVYSCQGFSNGILLAIRPNGEGLLDDSHIAWRRTRSVPLKPSVLVDKGLLYMIDDGGIATCLDAKTGDEIWHERISGKYSASPLLAGDRIYAFSEDGNASVLATGREFKILGTSKLPDGFMATPAIAGNALYLRTRTALYRVEE